MNVSMLHRVKPTNDEFLQNLQHIQIYLNLSFFNLIVKFVEYTRVCHFMKNIYFFLLHGQKQQRSGSDHLVTEHNKVLVSTRKSLLIERQATNLRKRH